MNAEQFVFWMRGYFASTSPENSTRGDWKAIEAVLKTVASPEVDAEVRRLAQARLRRERDDYLRELEKEKGLAPLGITRQFDPVALPSNPLPYPVTNVL